MALFDLKSLHSALEELQQERGISREDVVDALGTALAAAYRREYGKRGQIIRATFNPQTGDTEPANLSHNLYYKITDALWFGIYFHGNHHRRPLLFNPRHMPARADAPEDDTLQAA